MSDFKTANFYIVADSEFQDVIRIFDDRGYYNIANYNIFNKLAEITAKPSDLIYVIHKTVCDITDYPDFSTTAEFVKATTDWEEVKDYVNKTVNEETAVDIKVFEYAPYSHHAFAEVCELVITKALRGIMLTYYRKADRCEHILEYFNELKGGSTGCSATDASVCNRGTHMPDELIAGNGVVDDFDEILDSLNSELGGIITELNEISAEAARIISEFEEMLIEVNQLITEL